MKIPTHFLSKISKILTMSKMLILYGNVDFHQLDRHQKFLKSIKMIESTLTMLKNSTMLSVYYDFLGWYGLVFLLSCVVVWCKVLYKDGYWLVLLGHVKKMCCNFLLLLLSWNMLLVVICHNGQLVLLLIL